jgi:propionaldehyde dehydrogenase
MLLDERKIEEIVSKVVSTLRTEASLPAAPAPTVEPTEAEREAAPPPPPIEIEGEGVFREIGEAIAAARQAQGELMALSLKRRGELLDAMRQAGLKHAAELARMAVEETGMGRVEHKILKNEMAARSTPGLEDLPIRTLAGDEGLTLIQGTPYGTILAITPSTNPTSTVINNAISMVAAGNSVVFCPHPGARRCTLQTMILLNQAILEAQGPRNLLTSVGNPTLRVVVEAMKSPDIHLICATGGAGVVRAALESNKKAIVAGPGNPPVIVDETADLEKAARDIIEGACFDNNIPCVAEKILVAVEAIADPLLRAMRQRGAYQVTGSDIARLTHLVIQDGEVNKAYIGKDATVILEAIGIRAPHDTRLIVLEADQDHPLVQHEQMMPVLPLVRVRDFERALQVALEVEHGFGHTAIIHSRNTEHITRYAQLAGTTIFVANAPSYAWAGLEGEGYPSLTVAGSSGEGITSARSFLRQRHLVYAGGMLNVAIRGSSAPFSQGGR